MFPFLSCLLFPLFLLSSDLRGFWCLQLLLFARKLCSSLLPLFLCQDLGCVHGKSCIALIHCVELLFLSKESSGSFDCWSFTVLSLSSPLSPPHSLSPNFSFSFSYLFPLTSDPFFCFTVLVFSRHLDSFFCYYCCLSKEFFFFQNLVVVAVLLRNFVCFFKLCVYLSMKVAFRVVVLERQWHDRNTTMSQTVHYLMRKITLHHDHLKLQGLKDVILLGFR